MGWISYEVRNKNAEALKREIARFKSDLSCVKHLQMLSSDPYELNRQRIYYDKYTALETIETLLKEGAMDPCEFSEVAID